MSSISKETEITKKVTLTLKQKHEICEEKCLNPDIKNFELATQYGVKPNTISNILKQSNEYLSINTDDPNNELRKRN